MITRIVYVSRVQRCDGEMPGTDRGSAQKASESGDKLKCETLDVAEGGPGLMQFNKEIFCLGAVVSPLIVSGTHSSSFESQGSPVVESFAPAPAVREASMGEFDETRSIESSGVPSLDSQTP